MKHIYLLLLTSVGISLNGMEIVTQWQHKETFDHPNCIPHAVSFNKKGKRLGLCNSDAKAHVYSIPRKQQITSFEDDGTSRAICFSNNNNHLLALGLDNGEARIVNKTMQTTHSFPNKDIINAIAFNHDDTRLAVAANNTVRIFDLATKKRLSSIHQRDKIVSLCFNPHDNQIVTASQEKVRMFSLATKEKTSSFYREKLNQYYIISAVLFNTKNELLTIEGADSINIFNSTNNEQVNTDITIKIGNERPVISFHPETEQFALGKYGETLILERKTKTST